EAYDMISKGFGPGANGPLVIAAQLPSEGGEQAIEGLADEIRADEGVAYVPAPRFNSSDSAAIVTVIPTTSPQDEATSELVHRLRDEIIPASLADTGVRAEVGGVNAALEDQSEFITDRIPVFILGVLGLSFLLLLVAFHSPLISLKAGIMNLLSVSAA